MVGVPAVTHLLFMAASSYTGYPGPPAGHHRTPIRPFTPLGRPSHPIQGRPQPYTGIIAVPLEVSFLSVARALALRLAASRSCAVDGVSSGHGPGSRPPAHRPRSPTQPPSIIFSHQPGDTQIRHDRINGASALYRWREPPS